jgi:hypothetical protein
MASREHSEVVGLAAQLAKAAGDADRQFDLLRALGAVPMTYDLLVATKVGNAVKPLRKAAHAAPAVASAAKALVDAWRATVDAHNAAVTSCAASSAQFSRLPCDAARSACHVR